MTSWDLLNNIVNGSPPAALTLLLIAAVVIFIVGFSRHGMDFFKHGFKQNFFDELIAKLATKEDITRLEGNINRLEGKFNRLDSELTEIKTNHFGHLKNYLGILNGVLLDKDIIDNEIRARLDNELRGM